MWRSGQWFLVSIFVMASSCRPASDHIAAGETPRPTYSREAIRAMTVYGVHLGMDSGAACRILQGQGLARRPGSQNSNDCTSAPPLDGRDAFFRNYGGPKGGTPYGTVASVFLGYREVGPSIQVASIDVSSEWSNERDQQQDALEAATLAEWGEPTFYSNAAYRVLTYAESPDQADGDNRAHFDRCRSFNECKTPGERRRCIGIRRKYATAWMSVVLYNWGRTIKVSDETSSPSYREIARIDRDIRSGRLAVSCPIPTIH